MGGQGALDDVLEALRHLEYVCSQPVRGAIQQFRRALFFEHEDFRTEAMHQSLGEKGQWISRK
jgi:hypothetical protein